MLRYSSVDNAYIQVYRYGYTWYWTFAIVWGTSPIWLIMHMYILLGSTYDPIFQSTLFHFKFKGNITTYYPSMLTCQLLSNAELPKVTNTWNLTSSFIRRPIVYFHPSTIICHHWIVGGQPTMVYQWYPNIIRPGTGYSFPAAPSHHASSDYQPFELYLCQWSQLLFSTHYICYGPAIRETNVSKPRFSSFLPPS